MANLAKYVNLHQVCTFQMFISVTITIFGCGQFGMFAPDWCSSSYHVDRHGQLTLKQLRLSVLNEKRTNSYTSLRLRSVLRTVRRDNLSLPLIITSTLF